MAENSSVYPLAIVGDEDVIFGFKALGFNTYPLKDPKEFAAVLAEIVRSKAAICLVEENIYRSVEFEINKYRNLPQPIFIPFAKDRKTALLDNIVRDIRLRATGAF